MSKGLTWKHTQRQTVDITKHLRTDKNQIRLNEAQRKIVAIWSVKQTALLTLKQSVIIIERYEQPSRSSDQRIHAEIVLNETTQK